MGDRLSLFAARRFGRWLAVFFTLGLAAGCAGKPPAAPAATPKPAPTPKPAAPKSEAPAGSARRDSYRVPGVPLWRWESWDRHGKTHLVSKPEKYTVQLLANGWLKFSAECLNGEGMYETHDDRIVIALTRTEAERCRPGPMAEHFMQSLESASHYQKTGSRLLLDLGRHEGGMSFSRAQD